MRALGSGVLVGVAVMLLVCATTFPTSAESLGDQFGELVWGVALGEPYTSEGLVFFPIESSHESDLPTIVPLQAGIAQGVFALREIGDGYPDAVGVFSRNRQYGFGTGGGMYGGGRQGRGSTQDYMWRGGQGYNPYGGGYGSGSPYQGRQRYFAPQRDGGRAGSIGAPETQLDGRMIAGLAVPVVCVDRDRWSDDWTDMVQTGVADTATRRFLVGAAPQRDVWRQVYLTRGRLGVEAEGSRSYNDIFTDPMVATAIRGAAARLPSTSTFSPRTVGVVAMAGGRVRAMDLFGTPQLFRDMWPELVKGYALDALMTPPGPADKMKVMIFLDSVVRSQAKLRSGIALGKNIDLVSREVVGSGLSFEGELVHLAAFPAR